MRARTGRAERAVQTMNQGRLYFIRATQTLFCESDALMHRALPVAEYAQCFTSLNRFSNKF